MPEGQRPTTVRLQNLAQAYGQSAALMAAVELGLFTAISHGAGSFEEIAERLDLHPTNAERLTVMCAAMDLIRRGPDDRWVNADDVERFLVSDKKGYAGAWMLFTQRHWGRWGDLAQHLRAKALRVSPQIAEFSPAQARAYHEATYSIGMGAGRLFTRQVDLSGRRRILDLGGGSGCYCIQAAKQHPEIRGVVFELAPVAEVARDFIAEHGLSDRIEAIAGDFTCDAFPDDCDVAIMASNLPMYGRNMIADIVRRTHDALLPGGEMHLIGEMTTDSRDGPIGPAFWGLGQAIDHTFGLAHSEADVIGYFRSAGFQDVAVAPFVAGALSRVSGTKSAG